MTHDPRAALPADGVANANTTFGSHGGALPYLGTTPAPSQPRAESGSVQGVAEALLHHFSDATRGWSDLDDDERGYFLEAAALAKRALAIESHAPQGEPDGWKWRYLYEGRWGQWYYGPTPPAKEWSTTMEVIALYARTEDAPQRERSAIAALIRAAWEEGYTTGESDADVPLDARQRWENSEAFADARDYARTEGAPVASALRQRHIDFARSSVNNALAGVRDHSRKEATMPESGEFHWRDGWYFKRVGVDVQMRTPSGETVLIPANEWASIVTHVSAAEPTEHARTYNLALAMQMMALVSGLDAIRALTAERRSMPGREAPAGEETPSGEAAPRERGEV